MEVGGQEGGLGVGFGFGAEAEGDGHYFCFAEEESGGLSVCCVLVGKESFFGGEGGGDYLLSDNCVRTSLRYVLRMLCTLKT